MQSLSMSRILFRHTEWVLWWWHNRLRIPKINKTKSNREWNECLRRLKIDVWVKFDSMGNVLMIQRTYFIYLIHWDNTCSVTMPAICKCKYELLWAKHFYHHEYPDHCLFSFKYSNHCIVVSSGFYRWPVRSARYSVCYLGPVSLPSIITSLSINVLQGVIILMDLNHKMCGEWRVWSCWD